MPSHRAGSGTGLRMTAQAVGAYGEKVAEAELLRHGWVPANVNASIRNNADYDIFAQKGSQVMLVRVKTCGPGQDAFQFSFPVGRDIAIEHLHPNDVTILIRMGGRRQDDQCYAMPTATLWSFIELHRASYLNRLTRDGKPLVDTGQWTLRLPARRDGVDRPNYGFEDKLRAYLDNWEFADRPG
ncbi:hypothetical protein EDC65_3287 [Stella humosa]|uniref:PD(D/E)XK endonuclease domain-containing protein n=2 Tax=Stella humosa TaxID=94 RepID=A0A3N1L3F8_9PROT|nr:hypothetical protein EDC65_3287 [Stella humosa]